MNILFGIATIFLLAFVFKLVKSDVEFYEKFYSEHQEELIQHLTKQK